MFISTKLALACFRVLFISSINTLYKEISIFSLNLFSVFDLTFIVMFFVPDILLQNEFIAAINPKFFKMCGLMLFAISWVFAIASLITCSNFNRICFLTLVLFSDLSTSAYILAADNIGPNPSCKSTANLFFSLSSVFTMALNIFFSVDFRSVMSSIIPIKFIISLLLFSTGAILANSQYNSPFFFFVLYLSCPFFFGFYCCPQFLIKFIRSIFCF